MSDSQKGCYVKFLTKDEAAWQVDRIEKDRKDVMLTKYAYATLWTTVLADLESGSTLANISATQATSRYTASISVRDSH